MCCPGNQEKKSFSREKERWAVAEKMNTEKCPLCLETCRPMVTLTEEFGWNGGSKSLIGHSARRGQERWGRDWGEHHKLIGEFGCKGEQRN